MTLAEFKAWFEGYTDGMGDQPPNAKQWEAIKAKVDKITGTPIPYPIYVERYVRPWYPNGVWYSSTGGYASNTYTVGASGGSNKNPTSGYAYAAMYALGKAEAQLQ